MELNKEQLTKVVGGVSGAVLSTIVRGFKLAFDMGRHLGSSIRRFFTRNYCKEKRTSFWSFYMSNT